MSKNFKKLKKSRSRTLVPSAVSIEGSASSNPVIQESVPLLYLDMIAVRLTCSARGTSLLSRVDQGK
jgi:hypothetical protein